MIIRWTKQIVERPIKGEPYRKKGGLRRTLWFLFIPLFSITDWS